MRLKLLLVVATKLTIVGAAMLALVSHSSARTFELFSYSGNKYTTNPDPADFGAGMFAEVRIDFDSSVLTSADATGTHPFV
jgi:hypothetical protein